MFLDSPQCAGLMYDFSQSIVRCSRNSETDSQMRGFKDNGQSESRYFAKDGRFDGEGHS